MERITPERLLAIYEKRNLIPIRHIYFENDKRSVCCCGLGAFYLDTNNDWKDILEGEYGGDDSFFNDYIDDAITKQLDKDYVCGFILGFDGPYSLTYDLHKANTTEYLQGKKDGEACWEAVKHLSDEDDEDDE